jgi:hypothetical protein
MPAADATRLSTTSRFANRIAAIARRKRKPRTYPAAIFPRMLVARRKIEVARPLRIASL